MYRDIAVREAAQIVALGAEQIGSLQATGLSQVGDRDFPRYGQKGIGPVLGRHAAQCLYLPGEIGRRFAPAAGQQRHCERLAAAALGVVVAIGDGIHHQIARRRRLDAHLAQNFGKIVGPAKHPAAGAGNHMPFQARIKPGRARLVAVDIIKAAMAGDPGQQGHDGVTHHQNAVIAFADRAHVTQGWRNGGQPALGQVAAQRALGRACASRFKPGSWSHDRADAGIGIAAPQHRPGFDQKSIGEMSGNCGGDPILAMSVRNDQEALTRRRLDHS
mgnify:CR=1 FL=1